VRVHAREDGDDEDEGDEHLDEDALEWRDARAEKSEADLRQRRLRSIGAGTGQVLLYAHAGEGDDGQAGAQELAGHVEQDTDDVGVAGDEQGQRHGRVDVAAADLGQAPDEGGDEQAGDEGAREARAAVGRVGVQAEADGEEHEHVGADELAEAGLVEGLEL